MGLRFLNGCRCLLDALPPMRKSAGILLLLYFSYISPLWSCPLCADLLNRGRDAVAGFNLAQGLFWSILFMLTVPAVTAASLYLYMTRYSKKNDSKKK